MHDGKRGMEIGMWELMIAGRFTFPLAAIVLIISLKSLVGLIMYVMTCQTFPDKIVVLGAPICISYLICLFAINCMSLILVYFLADWQILIYWTCKSFFSRLSHFFVMIWNIFFFYRSLMDLISLFGLNLNLSRVFFDLLSS